MEKQEVASNLTNVDVKKNQVQTELGGWLVRKARKEKVEPCKEAEPKKVGKGVVHKEKKQGTLDGSREIQPSPNFQIMCMSLSMSKSVVEWEGK